MKVLTLLVFFLLLGAFFIISEKEIKLNSYENFEKFFISYGNWIEKLIKNGKIVNGYIVKMKWLPGEESE